MSREPKHKVGEVWKQCSPGGRLEYVNLVMEDNFDGCPYTEEIDISDGHMSIGHCMFRPSFEIVEDPKEKAYWLLRFENARV